MGTCPIYAFFYPPNALSGYGRLHLTLKAMGSWRRIGLCLLREVGVDGIYPFKVQHGLTPSSTSSSSFLPHLFEPASDMQTEPPIIVFSFIDVMYLYCSNPFTHPTL